MQDLPDMVAVKDAKFSDVDAVFCCLPHGITQVCKRFHHMLLNFDHNFKDMMLLKTHQFI